jgi:FAD-linked sulfhydryl oxidase
VDEINQDESSKPPLSPVGMAAKDTSQDDKKKKAVPPGMVMGPDGKPCKICTAFRNWTPGTSNHTESDASNKSRANSTQGTASMTSMMAALAGGTAAKNTTATAATTSTARPDRPPAGCPPDVEQLGRATWTFLHATAAYYPDKPTPKQRANMLSLLHALPILYPCTWCGQDFGEDLATHPPDVRNRTALSQWLCERHNAVNKKLGKETFDCSGVDERWKDGPTDGSCD